MSVSRSRSLPVVLGLLFLILGVFAWSAYRKTQLDNSSSDLIVEVLQSTLSSGSAEPVVSMAHSDWLSLMSAQSITGYIESSYRRLGPLQSMSSITGEADVGIISLPATAVNADYSIELQMGTNPVTAQAEMRYQDGQWWLTNLVLDSPLLMD
ncbi:MAG: hypothetical protein MI746_07530 [Pseudomonadales bacterium]|nr:hypothetical protein [Pseudomonadales bacterium]